MKKQSIFLAMLALVLVLGLAFVGCNNKTDESPELTEAFVITRADFDAGINNPITTIAANEEFLLRWIGKNSYEDLLKGVMTIKQGATVIQTEELPFSSPIRKGELFTLNTGMFVLPDGTYTIEVYGVDAKDNKSNTLTTALTVQKTAH